MSYREQIVEFIINGTGGNKAAPAPTTNVDPFTGGGAYIPGTPSGPGFYGAQGSSSSASTSVTGQTKLPFACHYLTWPL